MPSFPSGSDLTESVQALAGQITGTGVGATTTVVAASTQVVEPTTQIVGSTAGAVVDSGLPIPGVGGKLFGLTTFQFIAVGGLILGAIFVLKK